jgi:hypothetical protein
VGLHPTHTLAIIYDALFRTRYLRYLEAETLDIEIARKTGNLRRIAEAVSRLNGRIRVRNWGRGSFEGQSLEY